jgi:hypothetical protein
MPSSRKLLNMLRWPLTLYAPARTRLLTELVVAAVGAWRAGDQRQQVGVVAAHQRQRFGLIAGDGLAALAGLGLKLQRHVTNNSAMTRRIHPDMRTRCPNNQFIEIILPPRILSHSCVPSILCHSG